MVMFHCYVSSPEGRYKKDSQDKRVHIEHDITSCDSWMIQQCGGKVVLGCFGCEFDFVSPLDSMQAAFFGRGQALVWRAETDPKGPLTTRRAAGSSYCHVACPFM